LIPYPEVEDIQSHREGRREAAFFIGLSKLAF
jgi:hypothetical protein